MKIAVHMYFEERQHYCPAMLEFKSIPSEIQLFAQTEANRHVKRSVTIRSCFDELQCNAPLSG